MKMNRPLMLAGSALAALALGACSSSPKAAPGAPATRQPATQSATPAAAASPAEAQTVAAAKSAAKTYFGLYGAGQYAAVYPMIAPKYRRHIKQAVWVGVHAACPSAAAGLSYKISDPIPAGSSTVVFTVSLAGVASSLGSEQVTMSYTAGRWTSTRPTCRSTVATLSPRPSPPPKPAASALAEALPSSRRPLPPSGGGSASARAVAGGTGRSLLLANLVRAGLELQRTGCQRRCTRNYGGRRQDR